MMQYSSHAAADDGGGGWIQRWECARLVQETDDARDFLSALRMSVEQTEIIVDRKRRELRNAHHVDVLNSYATMSLHPSTSRSKAADATDVEVSHIRAVHMSHDAVAMLLAEQSVLTTSEAALVAEAECNADDHCRRMGALRDRLSHLQEQRRAATFRIAHVARCIEDAMELERVRAKADDERHAQLQKRIDSEKEDLGTQFAAINRTAAISATAGGSHAVFLKAVQSAQSSLASLESECLQLEQEASRLEDSNRVGIHMMLSPVPQEQRSHLGQTHSALTEALTIVTDQVKATQAALDMAEGQVAAQRDAYMREVKDSGLDMDEARWRARLVGQVDTLRRRLRDVQHDVRQARKKINHQVVKVVDVLPRSVDASHQARREMHHDCRTAKENAQQSLEEWSVRYNIASRHLSDARMHQTQLELRTVEIKDNMILMEQQIRDVDRLVKAYVASSSA